MSESSRILLLKIRTPFGYAHDNNNILEKIIQKLSNYLDLKIFESDFLLLNIKASFNCAKKPSQLPKAILTILPYVNLQLNLKVIQSTQTSPQSYLFFKFMLKIERKIFFSFFHPSIFTYTHSVHISFSISKCFHFLPHLSHMTRAKEAGKASSRLFFVGDVSKKSISLHIHNNNHFFHIFIS